MLFPRRAIFLVTQKIGHLTAFDGMPAKFLRGIHGPPRARVFAEIAIAQKVPVFVAII
jgi:hypothetical protein